MSVGVRGGVKMAIMGIRAAKWRSLLTMLGVIIGIVAVVTVVGIGEGVKRQIAGQIHSFGKDLITVRPGHVAPDHNAAKAIAGSDLVFGQSAASGLTLQDLAVVQQTAHVKNSVPLGVVPGIVQLDNSSPAYTNTTVLATNPDLPDIIGQDVPYGNFFLAGDEQANVAVMGRHVAQQLFQESVPLGRKFMFRGQQFMVRGIMASVPGTPLSGTSDFNDSIFIPYLTAQQLTGGSQQFYSILVRPESVAQSKSVQQNITQRLTNAHGGQQDVSVLNNDQNIAAGSNVLDLLTTLIGGVAAIALLVGGVGIMNIMLVSVTERMHEIGVRKAIGATNRQILNQFVLEATVLSLTGAVIGIVLSLVIDLLLHTYTSLKPVISWHAILIATVASLVIGIVFGAAPAIKAARKDPIDALRHE